MKGNGIDELFKKKLGHQKVAPPAGAWDRINDNLHQKKNKGITLLLSIAASLLAIFIVGKLALDQASPEREAPVAHSEEITVKESVVEPKLPETQNIVADNVSPTTKVKTIPAQDLNNTSVVQVKQEPATSKKTDINLELPGQSLARESSEVYFITAIRSRHSLPPLMSKPILTLNVNESFQDQFFVKKKRSRMISGILSIAKNVNRRKLGFSEMRAAKNQFVSNDLKYGGQEAEEITTPVDTSLR